MPCFDEYSIRVCFGVASMHKWLVGIHNTLQGRAICRLILGKRQHDMLIDRTWKIGGADLVWRRGLYYLNVTQSK